MPDAERLFCYLKGGKDVIHCDNIRCRFNQMELCTNMRLEIVHERCTCFELKYHRAKKRNISDLNHEPVPYSSRKRVFK